MLTNFETTYDPIDDPRMQPKLKVHTDQLSKVLHAWLDRHERLNPKAHKLPGESGTMSISGKALISMRAHVGEKRINEILNCKYKTTSFDVADRILTSIGEQAEFHCSIDVIEA